MPVLDTQQWVGYGTREWSNPGNFILGDIPFHPGEAKKVFLYQVYRKPVANDTPKNARTAAPAKQLIQTAANDFRGRLSTTSRSLPVEIVDGVIREYSTDLQRGGISKAWVQGLPVNEYML